MSPPAPIVGQPVAPSVGTPGSEQAKTAQTANDAWEKRCAAFGGFGWVTRPNRDALMAFTFPVEVMQVNVKPGQHVKAGDLLIRARDSEAVATLEVQKVRVENESKVQNAKYSLELSQIRFDAAERAKAGSAINPPEYEERRLMLLAAKATLADAQASQREEQQRLMQMQEQVQRYRLEARFDGVVDMLSAEPGQAVDLQQPVIRIVNTDPLWIDVPVPTDETLRLKLAENSACWVLLDVPVESGGDDVLTGRVLSLTAVTDASGAQRVRVEIANPRKLPAGTRAQVRFTDPGTASTPAAKPAARVPATEPSAAITDAGARK